MLRRPGLLAVGGSRALSRPRRRRPSQVPIRRSAGITGEGSRSDAGSSGAAGADDDNRISTVNKVMAVVSVVSGGAAMWSFGENKREIERRLELLPPKDKQALHQLSASPLSFQPSPPSCEEPPPPSATDVSRMNRCAQAWLTGTYVHQPDRHKAQQLTSESGGSLKDKLNSMQPRQWAGDGRDETQPQPR